jgi:hypothetical protein
VKPGDYLFHTTGITLDIRLAEATGEVNHQPHGGSPRWMKDEAMYIVELGL